MNKISVLVQIMSWRRPGDKPLFETTTVSLLTHKCITRPQWLNSQIKFPTVHGSQSWMFLYSCTVQISQSTLHPNETKSHQCSSTIIPEMICCRMEQIYHLSRCATLINSYAVSLIDWSYFRMIVRFVSAWYFQPNVKHPSHGDARCTIERRTCIKCSNCRQMTRWVPDVYPNIFEQNDYHNQLKQMYCK